MIILLQLLGTCEDLSTLVHLEGVKILSHMETYSSSNDTSTTLNDIKDFNEFHSI